MSFLKELGFFAKPYEVTLQRQRDETIARVVAQHRGLVRLRGEGKGGDGEWWAEPSGRLALQGGERDRLVVGDWVIATSGGPEDRLLVLDILPRTTLLKRQSAGTSGDLQLIAANVDTLLIVTSANDEFSMRRVERYLVLAEGAGVKARLILSKADLCPLDERAALERWIPPSLPFLWLSSYTGEGKEAMIASIAEAETVLIMGSSGVGKSSLVNELLKAAVQSVSSIRTADAKGRHTTTSRALFVMPRGGILIDTPGIRELSLPGDEGGALAAAFADIEDLAILCHFRDCAHRSEPGCAVQAAITEGRMDPGRLKNHQKLQREQAVRNRTPLERQTERKKWKAIHRSMKSWNKKDV